MQPQGRMSERCQRVSINLWPICIRTRGDFAVGVLCRTREFSPAYERLFPKAGELGPVSESQFPELRGWAEAHVTLNCATHGTRFLWENRFAKITFEALNISFFIGNLFIWKQIFIFMIIILNQNDRQIHQVCNQWRSYF